MTTRTPTEDLAAPASGDGAADGLAGMVAVQPKATSVTRPTDRAAASWGLGDGQAVPWEYAPAPESRDVVTIRERYGLFINGRDVAAASGETFSDVNPATEEILTKVAKGGPEDVDL